MPSSTLRQVSYVDSYDLLFEQKGSIAQNAVLLEDVDRDGFRELVVGNTYGTLCIYQFIQHKGPKYVCHNLGTISSISYGSIPVSSFNTEVIPVLIVVCAEGEIHFFKFDNVDRFHLHSMSFHSTSCFDDTQSVESQSTFAHQYTLNDNISVGSEDSAFTVDSSAPIGLHEQIQENLSIAIPQSPSHQPSPSQTPPTPTNNGGMSPLVPPSRSPSPPTSSFHHPPVIHSKAKSDIISPYMTKRIGCNVNCSLSFDIDGDGSPEILLGGNNRNLLVYKFVEGPNSLDLVLIKEIDLKDNQIHSMAIHEEYVIVGFVSGGFAIVYSLESALIIEPKTINFKSDPLMVVGNVKFGEDKCVALAGLGGEIMVFNPTKQYGITEESKKIKGSTVYVSPHVITRQNYHQFYSYIFNIQHEILTISPQVFIPSKDESQLMVSSWDGIIYIIDREKNVVTYNFKSPLLNCACGHFSLTPRHNNELVFMFSTSNDDLLHIYYNIQLNSMKTTTLLDVVREDSQVQELLASKLGNREDVSNSRKLTNLIHSLIYEK